MHRQLLATSLVLLLPHVALAQTVPSAPKTTGARLSLIDILTTYNKSVMRTPYFVEIQDIQADKVLKEYSVPYQTELQVRAYAEDARDNWKLYQDRVHWAMQVALNNDVVTNLYTAPLPTGTAFIPAPPVDTYYQNCVIQLGADLWTSLLQSVAGQGNIPTDPALVLPDLPSAPDKSNERGKAAKLAALPLSQPAAGGWVNDGVGLEFVLAPRVARQSYCKHTSANIFPPDYTAPYMPGNVYEMAVKWTVGPFSGTIGPAVSQVINWGRLYQRTNAAGTAATREYYPLYQKDTALSLAKNLPTAIHWDGAFLPSGGTRSGATIAPYYSLPALPKPGQAPNVPGICPLTSPAAASQHDRDVCTLAAKNPLFAAYLKGLGLVDPSDVGAVVTANKDPHSVGDKNLEDLKRQVSAGTFSQQQKEGMATFLHTWQQLDTVVDARPLNYWTPNAVCVNFVCTHYATPNPISSVTVTPVSATALATNTIGSGSTLYTSFRYRFGSQTTPEGHLIPGVTGHPVMRIDNE